ncbi:hypothetical protein [Arthrobacter sp. A2-55]|uniref:hypothetical protein n=1 Tax=Arthrobacter sp. A2-55 TaxID=2897337 RepID=UPI0021CD6036|nr:hypothetical protein [Arthrobacter sp. A2-55]MCU6480540.1 hypothetical protein [Arthrobacter sp. A2-55]
MKDYRVGHRAPTDDGYSNPLTRITESFGPDVFEHPENHGSGESDPETMRQLRAVRDNPEATVRIYRALPPGIGAINQEDWVTLSEKYARQHSYGETGEDNDWPVVFADVPAASVYTDGNDLAEYGYDGPALTGLPDLDGRDQPSPPAPGPWSDRTPEYHAASQALIDGSARAQLAAGFQTSGLDFAQLAARTGHSEQVARRIVAGKTMLNAPTVAVYFQAMGVKPGNAAVAAYEAEQVVLRRLAG